MCAFLCSKDLDSIEADDEGEDSPIPLQFVHAPKKDKGFTPYDASSAPWWGQSGAPYVPPLDLEQELLDVGADMGEVSIL